MVFQKMHAVCLQQVLDASNTSVQRWTLVLPASNTCRWLTVVLKRRFRFIRRFSRFIASLACCNPNVCYPPLCFDFTPRFASFSAALCIAFRLLHHFPCLALFSTFSHCFPHLLCFIARMSPALLGFPTVLLSRLHLLLGP